MPATSVWTCSPHWFRAFVNRRTQLFSRCSSNRLRLVAHLLPLPVPLRQHHLMDTKTRGLGPLRDLTGRFRPSTEMPFTGSFGGAMPIPLRSPLKTYLLD